MNKSKNDFFIDEILLKKLKTIYYPELKTNIIAMGIVIGAWIVKHKAIIKLYPLNITPLTRNILENSIVTLIGYIPEIKEIEIIQSARFKKNNLFKTINGVTAVIPIGSGKGGVGKSTIAVNTAIGLARLGLKIGLLDLDFYGPSLPRMLGLQNVSLKTINKMLIPIKTHGIKVMSIGFMIDPDKGLIWRSPIIIKIVKKLIYEVRWSPLDILIIDLPPGTGSIQITVIQETLTIGTLIVITPQDIALLDAIKAINIFRITNSPILGIVENMSYFFCDSCGKRHEIFGHGSVKPLANRLGIKLLGELPLDSIVRAEMDAGRPVINTGIVSAIGYKVLVAKIWEQINPIISS